MPTQFKKYFSNNDTSEFTFPELRESEKRVKKIPPEWRVIRHPDDTEKVFGKENLKNPKFKKELRRFEEKYGYKAFV